MLLWEMDGPSHVGKRICLDRDQLRRTLDMILEDRAALLERSVVKLRSVRGSLRPSAGGRYSNGELKKGSSWLRQQIEAASHQETDHDKDRQDSS